MITREAGGTVCLPECNKKSSHSSSRGGSLRRGKECLGLYCKILPVRAQLILGSPWMLGRDILAGDGGRKEIGGRGLVGVQCVFRE